jgi:RNA polymerase sigma-70 factor (ECF subfamily)
MRNCMHDGPSVTAVRRTSLIKGDNSGCNLSHLRAYAKILRSNPHPYAFSQRMADNGSNQITRLLLDWRAGDRNALDELVPLVQTELRRLARNYMRRQKAGHTLQTTALVNEAFIRLVDSDRVNWQDRNHFYAISAQLMRRILVDSARKRNSQKRGGERIQVTLDDHLHVSDERETDIIALDDALELLAKLSPRQARIVELRYFGGLTEEQIAETLEISSRTVRRDWNLARAFLFRELNRGDR